MIQSKSIASKQNGAQVRCGGYVAYVLDCNGEYNAVVFMSF